VRETFCVMLVWSVTDFVVTSNVASNLAHSEHLCSEMCMCIIHSSKFHRFSDVLIGQFSCLTLKIMTPTIGTVW